MRYLVFAIFQESDGSNLASYSKELQLEFKDPEGEAEEIIIDILESSEMNRSCLYELFVFKSAQNFGDAPVQVAYWNQEDDLFGPDYEPEEDSEDDG